MDVKVDEDALVLDGISLECGGAVGYELARRRMRWSTSYRAQACGGRNVILGCPCGNLPCCCHRVPVDERDVLPLEELEPGVAVLAHVLLDTTSTIQERPVCWGTELKRGYGGLLHGLVIRSVSLGRSRDIFSTSAAIERLTITLVDAL